MKIEIREHTPQDDGQDKVIKTVDCGGKLYSEVRRVEAGININMNRDEFYTEIVD